MPVSASEVYKEIGESFRHQLNWREKLFTGFLAVLAALIVAFYYSSQNEEWREFAWIVPLVGFFLSLVFLSADTRCFQGIRRMRDLGKTLEDAASLKGVYWMNIELAPGSFLGHLMSHTWVLRLLYGGTAIILLGMTITLLGEETMMSEFIQAITILTAYEFLPLLVGLVFAYLGYRLICETGKLLQGTLPSHRGWPICLTSLFTFVLGTVLIGFPGYRIWQAFPKMTEKNRLDDLVDKAWNATLPLPSEQHFNKVIEEITRKIGDGKDLKEDERRILQWWLEDIRLTLSTSEAKPGPRSNTASSS